MPDRSFWAEAAERARALGRRPVFVSGHQPGFWHPGVLAKLIALSEAAAAFDAEAVWLVVDQDEARPERALIPRVGQGSDGVDRVRADAVTIAEGGSDAAPIGRLPAMRVDVEAVTGKLGGVPEGPARGVRAMAERAGQRACEASAALQWTLAALDEAEATLGVTRPRLVAATGLGVDAAAGTVFRRFVEAMLVDPAACVSAYNEAIAGVPEAGLRPLVARPGAGRFELPLWHVPGGARKEASKEASAASSPEPRRAVFAPDAAGLPPEELVPRALCMTAVVRSSACDLFVHGLGGGVYERAVEPWIRAWLGAAEAERLAPFGVVTATRRLCFEAPLATEEERRRAVWRTQHARHNPGLVGDERAQRRKMDLVWRIAETGDRRERARLYQEMRGVVESAVAADAEALEGLEAEARRAAAGVANAAAAGRRDWAFPLYPDGALRSLAEEIRSRIGAEGSERA